jgi:NhaA family Na+:H+ antiporter
MPLKRFTFDFLKTEAGAGFLLAMCALLAIIWANSPWAGAYFGFIHHEERVAMLGWSQKWPIAEWVKEGLMSLFFLLVGLEIKFEVRRGALSNPKTLALPVIGAIGGMVVPALIYILANLKGGDLRGWSVPVATDIAFALAVLAMVGRTLPGSLRVFLLTLAIVDDLGAVAIIGIFYNKSFHLVAFAAMAGLLAVMFASRYLIRNVNWLNGVCLLLFVPVWGLSLAAGLSPSLAAVAAGFCIALELPGDPRQSPLGKLAHDLHPYVAYGILPIFAFTAAGFSFGALNLKSLGDPRFLGIALGLFVGKQLGVFLVAWGAVRLNLGAMPRHASLLQLYGVCLLCGIGFTMSLFLAALAFPPNDETAQNAVKFGVVAGSVLSACAGAAILYWAKRVRPVNE